MKTLLLLILFASVTYSHPYHHSLAEFAYNAETKQLELSLKILSEDYSTIQNQQKIQNYIQQKLLLTVNSDAASANYQGKEIEREFTWLYFTFDVEISGGFNLIEVTNKLFKNLHDNQFNTVKISLFQQAQVHNFAPSDDSVHVFVFE